MVFTQAHTTAFFEAADQMGTPHDTSEQLEQEGPPTPWRPNPQPRPKCSYWINDRTTTVRIRSKVSETITRGMRSGSLLRNDQPRTLRFQHALGASDKEFHSAVERFKRQEG
jgi:hypothetical protein